MHHIPGRTDGLCGPGFLLCFCHPRLWVALGRKVGWQSEHRISTSYQLLLYSARKKAVVSLATQTFLSLFLLSLLHKLHPFALSYFANLWVYQPACFYGPCPVFALYVRVTFYHISPAQILAWQHSPRALQQKVGFTDNFSLHHKVQFVFQPFNPSQCSHSIWTSSCFTCFWEIPEAVTA